MSNLLRGSMTLLFALLVLLSSGSRIEWVQSPKHAFVLLPPTLVTDSVVQRAKWSPDGAHLVIVTTPKVETSLDAFLADKFFLKPASSGNATILGWDRAHKDVKKLWTTDDPGITVCDVNWLTGSSNVFVTLGELTTVKDKTVATFGLVAIDAETGKISWVPGMEHLIRPPKLFISPISPIAVAVVDQNPEPSDELLSYGEPPPTRWTNRVSYEELTLGTDSYVTLGPAGEIKHSITASTATLAGDSSVIQNDLAWSKDGTQWLFATVPAKHRAETQKDYRARVGQKFTYRKLEESGLFAPNPIEAYVPPKPGDPELVIDSKPIRAKQRKTIRGYNNLWLSSPATTSHPDSLVTPNGSDAQLAPSEDAVFYVEGGIAKVRAVQPLTDEQKGNFYKALRQEALQDAKRSVLGLLMFAGDNDDVLPGENNLDGILPYVGDPDIFGDFIYAPGGNLNLTQIDSPASTVIGYIDAPGGRVAAYFDGHCKFIPNP